MNVQEVLNINSERRQKSRNSIQKILEIIHKKIKYYAHEKKESCSYIIPPIIEESVITNRDTVIKEVYKTLDEEGFIVSAFSNGQFNISWNEQLVQQKMNKDRYVLRQEEKRLNTYNRKTKVINDRFGFLANPLKIQNETSIEEKLDNQIEKILKQKEQQQQQLSKRVGNFTKVTRV